MTTLQLALAVAIATLFPRPRPSAPAAPSAPAPAPSPVRDAQMMIFVAAHAGDTRQAHHPMVLMRLCAGPQTRVLSMSFN